MYIKVRNVRDKDSANDLLINISKKAKIQELRSIIFEKIEVESEKQRLFYKGKLLVDDHCLVDYDVQLNDVIQLMVQSNQALKDLNDTETFEETNEIANEREVGNKFYKVGDFVDTKDVHGAWFEGRITKIVKKIENDREDVIFYVMGQSELDRMPITVTFEEMRPRSYLVLTSDELTRDMTVLINYNIDDPKELGYWYDFKITEVKRNVLIGTVLLGLERTPIDNCQIKLVHPVYRIEEPTENEKYSNIDYENMALRKVPYNCQRCKDVATRKCRECGCKVCYGKNNWEQILLCDECDSGYHIGCLTPPLSEIPQQSEWYCPECKTDRNEIVKPGEKLKFNKKKQNMPSTSKGETSRDWGKGMACVGRTKECTIVPKDHLGPIPGVDVGTCWKFRFQVGESGVHRPIVAGIHGKGSRAYSIVLSGGYEDDIDNGDEFYYTGSGGRDLSGNKRCNVQSCDQVLTKMNKALAMNCNAKFNPNDGAEAEDWKGGKPVRVVRNYKAAKHSKYAPKDGNRYDGIYKVVKYYPEKGLSGFVVWRYLLRRDDPNPAPWNKDGKELEMLYPPGYLEAEASKESEKTKPTGKRGSKRPLADKTNDIQSMFKKIKTDENKPTVYKLDIDVQKLINSDLLNEKLWLECKDVLREGKSKFLNKVEELFMCICCQDLVFQPVTVTCKHNICKSCIRRSFAAEIYTCPYCRFDLGKQYKFEINEPLSEILLNIFPGYGTSR